jgi:radical SAM superfamily enzyme YgiQ (UPF0313 family)
MPWQSAETPSIQLGILKSSLRESGIEADCLYANLVLAKQIGLDGYANIAGSLWYPFLREWLFNGFLVRSQAADNETLISLMDVFSNNPITRRGILKDRHGRVIDPNTQTNERLFLGDQGYSHLEYFNLLRSSLIPEYYDELLSRVKFEEYTLIGFTCTFSQLTPSLSFASEIKKRFPECRIALGGSALTGSIGQSVKRHFPQIDYVCDGPGEAAIVSMVRGECRSDSIALPFNIRDSPFPDYSDYFAQIDMLALTGAFSGRIPYESSRGCLWAKHRPCTFCALNNNQPGFHCKPIRTILHDIERLVNEYSPQQIVFVDNSVKASAYKEVFDSIKDWHLETSFFLEVKPTINKAMLTVLREAGVNEIQVGIESLSTELQIMLNKGTTLKQTLRFLADCSDLGINVHYNCLIGIPQETEGHYKDVLSLIPQIMHLPPPGLPLTPISLQKYSLYWKNPSEYSIRNVRPAKQYRLLYPEDIADSFAFVYDFDLPLSSSSNADYVGTLSDAIIKWRNHYYDD